MEAVLAWDAGQSFSSATGRGHRGDVQGGCQRHGRQQAADRDRLVGGSSSYSGSDADGPLDLRGFLSLELVLLSAATALSFIIFVTGQVHMALAGVLIALYVFYLWQSSRQEAVEPDLLGARPRDREPLPAPAAAQWYWRSSSTRPRSSWWRPSPSSKHWSGQGRTWASRSSS